jgi:16S rRNA (guanine(527)-N(7))-methyltransferase RsmG
VESAEGLKQLLQKSNIALESECAQRCFCYLKLLKKWNARINLTASTEWIRIEPLFSEAMWASEFYPKKAVSQLDIGSGAGFPALIMSIFNPQLELEMIESRARKSAFLETAAHALEMKKSVVHNKRLDVFLNDCADDRVWDFISWKALKLSTHDLRQLRLHAHSDTQFWMFHGRELALESPDAIDSDFRLLRRGQFRARHEWALSIYLPR